MRFLLSPGKKFSNSVASCAHGWTNAAKQANCSGSTTMCIANKCTRPFDLDLDVPGPRERFERKSPLSKILRLMNRDCLAHLVSRELELSTLGLC
jgi:hypothetical protein